MQIYLAAPWFSEEEEFVLSILERLLAEAVPAVTLFSPRHIGGTITPTAPKEERRRVFESNVKGMDGSQLALAVLYKDTGVTWELGYLFRAGIPIVGIVPPRMEGKVNLMLVNSFVDSVDFLALHAWPISRLAAEVMRWETLDPGSYVMTDKEVQ